jgi:hypothetical protein
MARNRPTTEPTPPPEPHPSHAWAETGKGETRCTRCGAYSHLFSGTRPCAVVPTPEPDPAPNITPAVPRHGRLVPAPDTPLLECPTNLDLTNPAHKALAFNALSAADVTVTAGGSIEFTAHHWLVHPVSHPNPETGEVHEYARTVFICADGTTVASCSAVVPHRLAAALSLFTPADWQAGVGFELRSRPRKRGPGNYHDLRCVTVPGGDDDA